jgi:hypothetical protein
MTMKQPTKRFAQLTVATLSITALSTLCTQTANAATIIKQPGQHTRYDWELEPHLALDIDAHHELNTGFGPGVSVAIPFMHQGPITTINNNMAIKFGFDLAFHDCDDHYGWRDYRYDDCSATSIMFPVALQWNFYITDLITVYGEPGLYLRHYWWSRDYPSGGCPDGRCSWDDSETFAWMYFRSGAKFMFGKNAGLNVAIGYPQGFTIGASILF